MVLTTEQFLSLQLQQNLNLHKVIFTKFLKLDPDPHKLSSMIRILIEDPDPQKMNAPQP